MAEEILSPDQINERLADVSKYIFPPNVRFAYVHLDDLREQDVNPQSMPQSMFDQLVKNIEAAGLLESTPLCVKQGDQIFVVSGHHRTRAARTAGLKYIVVILYEELPDSRVRSKQLAHNSINGMSDPELIKRVWENIIDVEAKFEAYIDPRIFKDIPQPVKFQPVDVDIQALSKSVLVVFLSAQKMDFDAAVEAIMPKGEVDQVYLAARETYDEWKAALQRVREEMDIVSIPTAVAEMARLAVQALDQKKASEDEGG